MIRYKSMKIFYLNHSSVWAFRSIPVLLPISIDVHFEFQSNGNNGILFPELN
jgi:hypothetical protein